MRSPITWWWNWRHRKLIEETTAIIRLKLFLRNEVGLKEELAAQELKSLLNFFPVEKKLNSSCIH